MWRGCVSGRGQEVEHRHPEHHGGGQHDQSPESAPEQHRTGGGRGGEEDQLRAPGGPGQWVHWQQQELSIWSCKFYTECKISMNKSLSVAAASVGLLLSINRMLLWPNGQRHSGYQCQGEEQEAAGPQTLILHHTVHRPSMVAQQPQLCDWYVMAEHWTWLLTTQQDNL